MIWIAFTFGLISSLHCSLMCAPLQAVVMGQWLRNGKSSNWLLYHSGRIFTYSMLGLLIGLLGTAVGLPRWQSEFSIVAGLVLLFGYFGVKAMKWDRGLNRIITPFLIRLQPKLRSKKGSFWYFASGSLNGLLPCGMVYAALIPAAGTASLWQAGLAMAAFGAGTLPLLLSLNLAGNRFFLHQPRILNKLIPLTVILISSILILRGMDLGIPYLSPEMPVAGVAAEGCK